MSQGSRRRSGVIVVGLAAVATVGIGCVVIASGLPPESAVAGWPRQLGTTAFDSITGVAVTSAGDVYVAGSTSGALPGFGNQGASDGFVARFDKFGNVKWLRQFGTSGIDQVDDVQVSGSSIFVSGFTQGAFPGFVNQGDTDGFVVRFDSAGNQKWVRQFGTSGTDVTGGVSVSGSSVYVGGYTNGAFPAFVTQGGFDGFVARFDSSGNQKWVRQFGTTTHDFISGIAASGGSAYAVGESAGSFPGFTNQGSNDGFVTRFDGSGNQQWLRQFGTSSVDSSYGVAVSGGGVYVNGTTEGAFPGLTNQGSGDGFVARFDTSGNQVWMRQFGTPQFDDSFDVAVRSGRVYAAGRTLGAFNGFTNQGGSDGFVARFDAAGNQQWVRQFGTSQGDVVSSVAVRSSDSYGGAVVAGGYTEGTVWAQARAGDDDGFVATMLS